jgi:hypothetical protein
MAYPTNLLQNNPSEVVNLPRAKCDLAWNLPRARKRVQDRRLSGQVKIQVACPGQVKIQVAYPGQVIIQVTC